MSSDQIIIIDNTDERIEIITPSVDVEIIEIHDGIVGPPGPPGQGLLSGIGPPTGVAQLDSVYLDIAAGQFYKWME